MTIEAYQVAVRIALIENVTSGLAALSRHFQSANAGADALEQRLARIGKMSTFGGAQRAAGNLVLKMDEGMLDEARRHQDQLAVLRFPGINHGNFASAMARDGDVAERVIMDAPKRAEQRGPLGDPATGGFTPDRFNDVLSLITKAYTASGGRAAPDQSLELIMAGGIAAQARSDRALFLGTMDPAKAAGPGRIGDGLLAGCREWVLGHTTRQIADLMAGNGMREPGQAGGDPGALKDGTDPFAWTEHLRATAIRDGSAMAGALSRMTGDRKFTDLMLGRSSHREGIQQSMATAGAGTLSGKLLQDEARRADLTPEPGRNILPLAIAGFERLNGVLERVMAFAREHGTLTKWVKIGAAGLAAAAGLGGVLMPVSGGIATLGLALKGFPAGAKLMGLSNGFTALGGALGPLIALLAKGGVYGAVAHGVVSAVDPEDKAGGWMDKTIPGMSWIDDKASKVGFGLSYAEQREKFGIGGQPQTINLTNTTVLDGKVIATSVTKHMADGMDRAPDSGTGFDGRQSLAPTFLPMMP